MSEPPIIPDDDPGPVVSGWNDSPVAGDRVDLHEGPIIAGDPEGARVEVTETGLRAYDSAGIETASIAGEGGEFVGGEFRTSDTLPGQVTLANDAYINSATGVAHPGIRVEPLDTSAMARPPGIGPGDLGLYVDGGSDTSGRRSYFRTSPTASLMRTFREGGTTGGEIQTSPSESLMRTFREDGTAAGEIAALPAASSMRTFREDGTTAGVIQASPTESLMRTYREDGTTAGLIQTSPSASFMRTYREDGTPAGEIAAFPTRSLMRTYSGNSSEQGWVRVQPQDAELAYVDPLNTYFSRIRATETEAHLFTRAGGMNRYLTVDADGIWVKTGAKSYNLEETAQDSGWQSVAVGSGITPSASFAWRNKGGVIWWRGTVTATWVAGWNDVAADLPAAIRPEYGYTVNEAGTASGVLIRVQVNGVLQLYAPTAGTSTHRFTSLSYPVG